VYGIKLSATCFCVHWAHYRSKNAVRDICVGRAETKKKENAAVAAVDNE
jgi:hypothetical protein